MLADELTPESFRRRPGVVRAVENPRSPRSVLNYMCGCDTAKPEIRDSLNQDETVRPLMTIWFQSGRALDAFCQPFAPVVRELKSDPPSLTGEDWTSLEGKVAKVLLADQLSRSCFRGSAEALSYDPIARDLMRALMAPQMIEATLTLPAAILYLLPWALAHSEDVADLDLACDFVDLAIEAYRYYVSQTVLKHGAGSCPVGRVPAGEIEAAVIDQLRAVFRQTEIVAGTWKAARAHADNITEADSRATLQQFYPLWDELFPAEQARIAALLVERVDIGTDGLNVRLRVDGLSGLAREMLAGGIGETA